VDGVAAFAAWAGASLIVLADGRRALAVGLGLIAAALAFLAWQPGGWPATTAIVVGGAIAAILRWRTGPTGWGVMPPGSTSRLVLSTVAGILGLWFAASLTSGAGGPLRFAALVVLGVTAMRVLTSTVPAVVLTSVASLAFAVAAASGMAPGGPGPALFVAAALIAVGASLLRVAEPRVA
jgi:hypothetical protein